MKKFLLFIAVSLFLSFSIFAESIYVCVASFVNKDNAMKFAKTLENDDEDVCLSEFVRADGQLFYRVLLRTNTQDADKARDEASALKGAFIVISKTDENIETIIPSKKAVKEIEKETAPAPEYSVTEPKAETKEPETVPVYPRAPGTSPVSLRSGATEIISSIADFEAFAEEVEESIDEEEDDFEKLMEFFEDMTNSEEVLETDSAKELVNLVQNIQNKFEEIKTNLANAESKTEIDFDGKIESDLSDLIPGFYLNECFVKTAGNTVIEKDEDDVVTSVELDGKGQVVLDYRYNLREIPYKTFIKDMAGRISVSVEAKGFLTEESGKIDTNLLMDLHQEVALCNSRGFGGVILLEGTVTCSETIDPELIALALEDEDEFLSQLDKLIKINLKFRVYDDEGRVHYLSTFKSLKSLYMLTKKD